MRANKMSTAKCSLFSILAKTLIFLSLFDYTCSSKIQGTLQATKGNLNRRSNRKTSLTSASEIIDIEISQTVLHILNARLDMVLSGKRGRQFSRAYRFGTDQIDGAYTIVSAHGGKQTNESRTGTKSDFVTIRSGESDLSYIKEQEQKEEVIETSSALVQWKPSLHSVFPDDMTSLEMSVYTSNPPRKDRMTLDKPSILRLTLRAMRLSFNFFPCISTAWLAFLSPTFRSKCWFKLVSSGLSRSGPAFIKWGQWSSTRPDMFPVELCDALTNLHADAPSHSWQFTQASVEESLSIPKGSLFQIFESFDMEPIASGSIAQVHRAVLRPPPSLNKKRNCHPSGTTIAVKVRHPNVATLLDHDFRLMKFLASLVEKVPSLHWLHIKSSVEQFSHTMAAQAHLDVEAHHLEVLNHNFRKWKRIGFPKPIFASEAVIIETYEKGTVVTDMFSFYDDVVKNLNGESNTLKQKLGFSVEEGYELVPLELSKFLVTSGAFLYLKMMVEDGLMHADLHPGNILFRVLQGATGWEIDEFDSSDRHKELILDGNKTHVPLDAQVTLVDAGMVAKLTPEESNNFIGLMVALGEGDAIMASRSVLNFSTHDEDDDDEITEEEKEAFTQDMIELFERVCRGYGTKVDVGEVLRGVLNLIRIHKIRIDANYATLVVNALCVTSMAFKLVPEYNVLDASKPLFKAYNRLCTDGEFTECKVR